MKNQDFIILLEKRFNENMHRHPNHNFSDVLSKLNDKNIESLIQMEKTGGEVDVIDLNNNKNE